MLYYSAYKDEKMHLLNQTKKENSLVFILIKSERITLSHFIQVEKMISPLYYGRNNRWGAGV